MTLHDRNGLFKASGNKGDQMRSEGRSKGDQKGRSNAISV